MRFTLCLIPLLLLSSSVLFVTAQGNDEFGSIAAFFSIPVVYISFVWDGEAGHQLSNISMELMSGKDTVEDIIALNVSPTVGTLYYQPHPMMPNGNYFVRVNGTVTNGDSTTPLSTASGSSPAFDIPFGGPADTSCLENTWTPVRSVEDPNYEPVRVILPEVGTLASSTSGGKFIFDRTTAEVINTETGFNVGAQEPGVDLNGLTYATSNLTLDPGPWQASLPTYICPHPPLI
ncbi:hypothetical protein C8R45DRAFT_1213176 [Mycena sanguinolenta]|nr:hypothetical protein C8R45DRAFT_1213176 [Mycena sanguinolenta]